MINNIASTRRTNNRTRGSLTLLALTAAVLLGACSSSRDIDPADYAGKLKDKFTTSIKGDGIKLFTYTALIADERAQDNELLPHEVRGRNKAMTPNDVRRMRNMNQDMLEDWAVQVELGLSKTLAMSHFCREGYIELSRVIEPSRGEIRGECNEGATEEDKLNFVR